MRSWRDVLINDSQNSKACRTDDAWIKMKNSYSPIYLLPEDPFEMNKVSENDADRRIFGETKSSIGRSTDDCTVRGGVPILDSGYQRRKPLLSSFETQLKYEDDFNNIGSSGLTLDLTGAGKLGAFKAAEEASILEREMTESVLHLIEDESVGTFEHIKKDLVLGRSSPGFVIDVAGNQSFGACEDVEEILYTGRRHAKLSDGDMNNLHKQIILPPKYWVR